MSTTTEPEPRGDQLEQRVEELEAKLKEKDERIETQAQRIDELEEENNNLREELKEYREHNERDKAQVKKRVTDVENELGEERNKEKPGDSDKNPRSNDDKNHSQTPLDQVVSLPEHVAQQELTENQARARFIAKDILDYATSVPAGYTVTSSDIRTILAAKEGGTPHTETVSRVMNFLDRLGQDDVKIVKRNGKRRVVFTEEAAKRCHHANARDQEEITGVVMGTATG